MAYKSNITVASNIYPRISSEVRADRNFVANVRGGVALRDLDNRLYGMGNVKLNDVQKYEMSESVTCSFTYNYLREMTHGPIKTESGIVWQCRCENVDCDKYSSCMPDPLVRELRVPDVIEISKSSQLEYEWLGTIEKILTPPNILDDMAESVDEPIPQEYTEATTTILGEFVKLEEITSIIEADINSHIFINAGPGTGKTYTVIERLAHIINNGTVDLSQVLVLCYTNAARDVILKRLDEKGLFAEARQLVICTLDSLAWNNLTEKSDDDLFSLGFNGCIQKFNAEFDADEWIDFEYVIIDELQDLVNERARMTLKILSALQCGYLLLGDKCQAIYDYDCNGMDSISSVGFYSQLDTVLPDTAQRYELIGNKRQSTELSRRSDDFREALLGFSIQEANIFFKDEITALPKKSFFADSFTSLPSNGTTAILTRNNGEAEWVSALLHKANISHNLMRSVSPRPSLNRWIADVFWDYREPRISREDFIERYLIRLKSNEICAVNAYDAIVSTLSSDIDTLPDYIELREVNQALKRGQNLSPLLTNNPCEELTVSTIHKAKGREFDHVYLLSGFTPSDDNTEEARVWYVGATRPKTKLDLLAQLSVYISKPTQMNRRMITGYKRGRYGTSGIKFCSNIVVGLTADVNNFSFVDGDLYQALDIQRYLSGSVKVNDTVEIINDAAVYKIVHKGFEIGALAPEVTGDFWEAIRKTGNRNNIPPHLTDIYVSNILTVIPRHFPSGADPMFKESQFWLGVELTGFAKADWHFGGN
jgi:hypothetical protein